MSIAAFAGFRAVSGLDRRNRALSAAFGNAFAICAGLDYVLGRFVTMKTQFRSESDSMGEVRVSADAYYGAQTARAVENFPVSGLRFSRAFIRALGLIKKHAAITNADLGLLDKKLAAALQQAAQEVAEGKLDAQFVVDIFQTGSGTSTNMNANEVIANRAAELLGGKPGDKSVHPKDHVNRGQSSNDVIPTATHLDRKSVVEGK